MADRSLREGVEELADWVRVEAIQLESTTLPNLAGDVRRKEAARLRSVADRLDALLNTAPDDSLLASRLKCRAAN